MRVAVDAANPGDLLTVTGTCVSTTGLTKTLAEGSSVPESEQAILDGNGASSVLSVAIDVNVTVTELTIAVVIQNLRGHLQQRHADVECRDG